MITGAMQYKCPNCYSDWREPREVPKYYCRGCWEVKPCICHHTSYDPERVVPMCNDCHNRLHNDGPFLDHLDPDQTREDAKTETDIEYIGLGDTEYSPVETELVQLND
mgnify:CR=1 FL=1